MEVGAANESVTITGEAPILQTDRADVSSQLDKAQITNLPDRRGTQLSTALQIDSRRGPSGRRAFRRGESATVPGHQFQWRVLFE